MVRVVSVVPNSIGDELGIVPGTQLITVNGTELHDFLDWEFLTADDEFILLVRFPDGQAVEFDIERPEGAAMGLELEPPRIRRCGNRCDFCFVDGLPQGLRSTLYVRDDDYRLSFRHGNFATLTNLKPQDIDRIIAYRLSPLHVSVHATDPVVRRRLLRNPRAPAITTQLQMFASHGIRFHTQIVLQPGVNDGAVLEQSLQDLYELGDAVLSVSVVPVGLTTFSKHGRVRAPTREECRHAIGLVHDMAARASSRRNQRWVHGSDELYMVAELSLPPAAWYGSFDQMENGVGSVRYLEQRIEDANQQLTDLRGSTVGVVTGTAMARLMPHLFSPLAQYTGATFELVVVENTVFGPDVTTAGLLPGAGIRNALPARGLQLALLPAESLSDAGHFVDDLPLESVTAGVPYPVRPSYDFVDVLSQSPTT